MTVHDHMRTIKNGATIALIWVNGQKFKPESGLRKYMPSPRGCALRNGPAAITASHVTQPLSGLGGNR